MQQVLVCKAKQASKKDSIRHTHHANQHKCITSTVLLHLAVAAPAVECLPSTVPRRRP
jgi:hypothetical protein